MTAHDILTATIKLRGESTSDTELFSNYNDIALVGMNEAYRHICATIIHPTVWQSVALDASKQFDIADLTSTPQEIIAVAQYQDYTSAANWSTAARYGWTFADPDTVVVPGADASGTVYVCYEVLPADLINTYPVAVTGHAAGSDATSPSYIPTQYHQALAMKANAKIWARDEGSTSDQSAYWEAQYLSFIENMEPAKQQSSITNVYAM